MSDSSHNFSNSYLKPVAIQLQRRQLLLGGAAIAGFPFLNVRAQDGFSGADASVEPQGFWERPRWVWLKRPATGEQIKVVYWQDGSLIPESYERICWFLRDVRFQKMMQSQDVRIRRALDGGIINQSHLSPWVMMDPVLIDILYAYSAWLSYYGVSAALLVNSGFRHLITNSITEGAARNSQHVKGGAADIVVPGVRPAELARFGLWLSGGGVGLYESRGFIHIDRGRVRTWKG